MKVFENIAQPVEWYRGQGIASKSIENPSGGEGPFLTPTQPLMKSETPEHDPAVEEREAKLESWMEEVKAFIRNIDVNNL